MVIFKIKHENQKLNIVFSWYLCKLTMKISNELCQDCENSTRLIN